MGSTLFRGGTVIDGTGAAQAAQTSVMVDGDRIAAVGPEAELAARATPETAVVDLAGRTILPGLIDLHVHSSLPSEMPV